MLAELLVWIILDFNTAYAESSGALKDNPEDFIPCDKDWYFFRDKCYILRGKRKTGRLSWDNASQRCSRDGGTLVTVETKEVQEFLVTFLLLEATEDTWIGLHDRSNESQYEWDDGSLVNYTNWRTLETTGRNSDVEDCVEMVFEYVKDGGQSGLWNACDCKTEKAYICQTESKQMKRIPDPRFCSGKDSGWKLGGSCYHVVRKQETWKNAEKHCQDKFKGHLVTILDFTVELFIDYFLNEHGKFKFQQHGISNFDKEMWIGIKIQKQLQQKWSSGWHVAYNNLPKDPEYMDGECVLRTKHGQWKNTLCNRRYSFICETSTVIPPMLKQASKGAQCPKLPHDWRDLDGEFCYFIDVVNNFDWKSANFECIRRGGSLVSLHSAEEVNVLQKFVIYKQVSMFIGLLRVSAHENVFVWSDGSHVDYVNWKANEPNNEEEKCGEIWTKTMEWNDASCDDKKGYICSVRKIIPNITVTEEGHECAQGITYSALIGVSVCILLVVVLLAVVFYYCRGEERRKRSNAGHHPPPVPATERPRYRTNEIIVKEDDCEYDNMQ